MEDLWSFSPKSDSYLQHFITTANENQAPESRFLKFFQQREQSPVDNKKSDTAAVKKDEVIFDLENNKMETFQNIIDAEDIAHYSFVIENNLDARFTDIVQECVKDNFLFLIFAENLHQGVTEKFLTHAFKQTDLPEAFIKGIFSEMFPVLLKKGNSRTMLELLIKSHTLYKDHFFVIVLPILLHQDISEDVLLNLVKNCNEEEKNELMSRLCAVKLNGQQFVKHLPTILELYKDVNKSDEIQKYILCNLMSNSELCCNDKTYGRLLLTFLQNVNIESDIKELLMFSNLVSNHFSIFQRPCENALRALSCLL